MKKAIVTVLLAALVGCGGAGSSPAPSEDGLQVDRQTDALQGSFTLQGDVLNFKSVTVADKAVEVTLSLHGMTLLATIDATGAADLDAFGDDTGKSTQMSEADRTMLKAFNHELSRTIDQRDSSEANFLLRFTGIWSEFPGTIPLQRLVLAEENRSYTSLCGYANQWWNSTHDGPWLIGCDTDRWEDKNSYYGYLSTHGDGPCSDDTYFWNGSSWVCYEPDHSTSVEYAYGSCFGNCGGGCDSAIDYTIDCADHDSCVRFGHDMAAVSCDDEFSFTVDDWGFAPVCTYL